MGAQETRSLKEQFMMMLNILDNMEMKHCQQLSQDFNQQSCQDLIELSLIHDDLYDNCIVNIIDEKYDIYQHLQNL